jgi:hypothetical protein
VTFPDSPQEKPEPELAPSPHPADEALAGAVYPPHAPPRRGKLAGLWKWTRDYFLVDVVVLSIALVPMCFLSMILYTRKPGTNFIFDEQEALLANPYVRASADPASKIGWLDAFYRDFWGLTPDRTIGSYRPLPDLVWRLLWKLGAREQTPFLHHWVNVLLHGLNGALVALFVWKLTRRHGTAWTAGAFFVASAVITEAVSGVVGISDVMGGLGAILCLLALTMRTWTMPIGVFVAALVGLYSKETALVVVPLVPVAAVLTAQMTHPEKPRRWLRGVLALFASAAAFVLYVELRRRMFPVHVPDVLSVEANAGKPWKERAFASMLRWYAQPGLPHDPLNNPLINADRDHRIAGALRVYWRGLTQIVFPWTLSGDYSAPQEPIPDRLVFPESILGTLGMIVPVLAAPVLGILGYMRLKRTKTREKIAAALEPYRAHDERAGDVPAPPPEPQDLRPLAGVGLIWVVLSFFPVSNIPVLLPTVRAERFWYFPVIGSAIFLAIVFTWLWDGSTRSGVPWTKKAVVGFFILFFGFQCFAARKHALDYNDDLTFWEATRRAVPRSAKAHLNYSVMLGARGDLPGRLAANRIAFELAPDWPMASVYLGDTQCRMHHPEDAMPDYLRGFDKNPQDPNLIALGLQCLWDENMIRSRDTQASKDLQALADKYYGSWLKYLVDDVLTNGETNNPKGVNPKYRPRGYNEGPKKDE